MTAVRVVLASAGDGPAVETFLRGHHALDVARRGEVVRSTDHPGLVAWSGDEVAGAATYLIDGDDCELLTLHCAHSFGGTGSALLSAVASLARGAGCSRLTVVTTNDNVDALRFYQRRGFRLSRLRPGAVDDSRDRLKPGIPALGAYGIALRDELELVRDLSAADPLDTDDHR